MTSVGSFPEIPAPAGLTSNRDAGDGQSFRRVLVLERSRRTFLSRGLQRAFLRISHGTPGRRSNERPAHRGRAERHPSASHACAVEQGRWVRALVLEGRRGRPPVSSHLRSCGPPSGPADGDPRAPRARATRGALCVFRPERGTARITLRLAPAAICEAPAEPGPALGIVRLGEQHLSWFASVWA